MTLLCSLCFKAGRHRAHVLIFVDAQPGAARPGNKLSRWGPTSRRLSAGERRGPMVAHPPKRRGA
eukprot:3086834-Alexandrium_andersonii.AAC.1